MNLLAQSPAESIDPGAIVIIIAMVLAAAKRFLDKRASKESREEIFVEPAAEDWLPTSMPRPIEPGFVTPRRTTPPPLTAPQAPQTGSLALLSLAEKTALENLHQRKRKQKTSCQSKSTKSRVYRHLSSPTAAREALVLAEVLGPPTSLKNDSRF